MSTKPQPWMIALARLGQLAKGFIFGCIGLLAALAAFPGRGNAQDSRGVMRTILQQPFGRVLLLAIIAGLICYIIWRVVAALADLERKGTDAKGLLLRARMLLSAAIYSGITAAAVKMVAGAASGGGGSDQAARDWTASAMATPFGAWLVFLFGLGLVGYGLFQFWRAYRGQFEKKLQLSGLGALARKWLVRVCAFGIAARGVVFCIIGFFLVRAGLESDAQEARGLSGAVNSLQARPYGRWLFAIVAAGLALLHGPGQVRQVE